MHQKILKCCAALDTSNGVGSTEPLSLEKCHSLMQEWGSFQKDLEDGGHVDESCAAILSDYKTCFFDKMQQGFWEKRDSIRADLFDSLVKVVLGNPQPSEPIWKKFETDINDFLRLGTADTFTNHQQEELQLLGKAMRIVYRGALACAWVKCVYLRCALVSHIFLE